MIEKSRRYGLGRGLSTLLGEPLNKHKSTIGFSSEVFCVVSSKKLQPGRFQPRRIFDHNSIDDLVKSVREKGILQPILVRPRSKDPESFEIISGERRWRASQIALLDEVPVIIRNLSDREAMEVALIDNLQRRDLSPIEEAEGYCRLIDEFLHTQEELAKTVGKSRSHIANMMRLLGLPEQIKNMLNDGILTAGHARALLTSTNPVFLAKLVIKNGLNVRQTEKLANQREKKTSKTNKNVDLLALERDMTKLLGFKVLITLNNKGGRILMKYSTLEQLDDVLNRLSNGLHGIQSQLKR
ncbi:MAG: ParB/RepB/Spo0J family partition protein [Rhodospirillaceae bacterium]|jgi:ParB family chromosome partitioning protein|nr:ParB/RepB/Spo0J family partition protein [Rhodospirillaceae bacterium]